MAMQAFLKLDKVPGSSQDKDHKDEIDVLWYKFEITQSVTTNAGQRTGGRVDLKDLVIKKKVDKATPLLVLNACKGFLHDKATLVLMTGGGDNRVPYLKVEMEKVVISRVESDADSTDEAGIPTETIHLNFGLVHFAYTPHDSKGKKDTPIKGGWDRDANHPWNGPG